MRIRALALSLLALTATAVHAGELVKVAGGAITFVAPDGFKPVPQEIIDTKWPSKRGPAFVIGNQGATTTVSYDFKPHGIPTDKLGEVKESFTQQFSRVVPGIVWKKNEIVDLGGRKWIYFEMTSNAVDTDIYNMMLLTGYKGRMLVFNFNSTREDFPKYEKQLRASLRSIKFTHRKK